MSKTKIRKRYQSQIDAQNKAYDEEMSQKVNESDTSYDNNKRSAYVSYMKGKKNLAGQLKASGITGGGAETMNLRNETNYQNQVGSLSAKKSEAANTIKNAYSGMKRDYKLTADAQMNAELSAQEQTDAANEYNRYAATVGRYNTVSKVNAAITQAKKAGRPKWVIQLLQAQKATLQDAKKSGGSSGGSGGGSGGSSGVTYVTEKAETTKTPKKRKVNTKNVRAKKRGKKKVGRSGTWGNVYQYAQNMPGLKRR